MTHRVIQIYRGTKAQNDAFTGAVGELTMDTTNNELRLHDGTTVGGHKIGGGVGYIPDLFDTKWADHEINDQSWLRADTFSWQDGTVYSNAYNHLVDDINGKSLTSETIAGTTVQFYLANDGHKICPANQESNVAAIYTATGVAWYYILDETNTRFKLPRTKFGLTGLRDTVGNYVAPGLPNITGDFEFRGNSIINRTGAFGNGASSINVPYGSSSGTEPKLTFDASASNAIYGASTTVQPPATQMYLYFYVGQFSQSATEQTAGLNASLFNGKADIDAGNFNSAGKSVIAGLPMPSTNNIGLTLGISGASYTAPANGWVSFGAFATTQAGAVVLRNDYGLRVLATAGNGGNATIQVIMPVKKGSTFCAEYSDVNFTTWGIFNFIYADGEQ